MRLHQRAMQWLRSLPWRHPLQRFLDYCTASIERFLIASFLGVLTTITLILMIINHQQLARQNEHLFRVQLIDAAHLLNAMTTSRIHQQKAHALQSLLNEPEGESLTQITSVQSQPTLSTYLLANSAIEYQVWDSDTGQMLLRSSTAPLLPLSDVTQGFQSFTDLQGIHWQTYTENDLRNHTRIIIAVNQQLESTLNSTIWVHDLVFVIFFYMLIAAIIIGIVRVGLRHLKKVAKDLSNTTPDDLKPIATEHLPSEVLPLSHAINQLFFKIDNIRQREQQFTADAAHELRTPLAGFKTHIELAMRASNEPERIAALQNALTAANRSSRVIDQLLTLSRLDPEAELESPEVFALQPLCEELLAEIAVFAVKKQITLGFDAPDKPLCIKGDRVAIGVLVRNLVDNAIRYTPNNGTIDVTLSTANERILLHVADNGPGIPDADLPRIFDRFFRVNGTRETGSGLGLAIVKEIARLHKATITLQKPAHHQGLEVIVSFAEAW